MGRSIAGMKKRLTYEDRPAMFGGSAFERLSGAASGRRGPEDVEPRRGREGMRLSGQGTLMSEQATGDGDRELLMALDGHIAGRSMREIAVDLYGAERVAAEWAPDGVLRAQTRRLLRKARAHAERG